MKFIQSFWSKPLGDIQNKNNWSFRHNGGFTSPFLFYCCWTYSCLSIKKYYPNLHLVTDDHGLKMFRDVLNLPYTSFSNALNEINEYDKGLWALGKLYTYKNQREPFCHLDGDVFLFGRILDSILNNPIFCQSFDRNMNQYVEIHNHVHKNFRNIPKVFDADLSKEINLINAGVVGGSNLSFFQEYTKNAFKLIDDNKDILGEVAGELLNLYYEQFLFSNMIKKENLQLTPLIVSKEKLLKLAEFHQIPSRTQYIHLISYLKKSTECLEQVVVRLSLEYPEYYKRIKNFFKKYN